MADRILVLGSSGSGKTTITRQLAQILNLEAIHLDSYYWRPNWTPTPNEEWNTILLELLKRERWVMDGNYPSSLKTRLAYADSVVFLDYNRYLCLWRCVQRWGKHRGHNRPDLAVGCNEKIDWDFFLWIWNYPRKVRPGILTLLDQHAFSKEIHRLISPQKTIAWIKKLAQR